MTMLFKKYGAVMLAALTLALLLAACGDATGSPPAITMPPTTTSSARSTTAVAASTSATTTNAATTAGAKLATPVKLTLALDWVPNTNHTGFFVAQQKGWYKEAGIDLQILPYVDGADPTVLVSEGKADFGIAGADGVATARAAGAPVVSLAAIIQHNTSGFAVLKDGPIKRPRDLSGKKYAGFGATYEEAVIASLIKNDGGSDTKIQNITTNAGGYQAVAARQADFVWIYAGWELIQALRDNVPMNMFLLKDYGFPDFYTPALISSENDIKTKAEALKVFMAVTARGFDFAIANPKEAADLLIAANPKGTFTDLDLVYQSQQYLSAKYKEDASKWGVQNLKAWTEYPRFLFETGALNGPDGKKLNKEPDYTKFFTNDFLP